MIYFSFFDALTVFLNSQNSFQLRNRTNLLATIKNTGRNNLGEWQKHVMSCMFFRQLLFFYINLYV